MVWWDGSEGPTLVTQPLLCKALGPRSKELGADNEGSQAWGLGSDQHCVGIANNGGRAVNLDPQVV